MFLLTFLLRSWRTTLHIWRLLYSQRVQNYLGASEDSTWKDRFTHSMPCPFCSPAMPCRYGFRMCLSHVIYIVRPCLIHTCHAMLWPCRSSQGHGMVGALHGRGMASVNQTRPHCVNQLGKTHCKTLAARHGRGTAWAQHGNGILCANRPYVYRTWLYTWFYYKGLLHSIRTAAWICLLS